MCSSDLASSNVSVNVACLRRRVYKANAQISRCWRYTLGLAAASCPPLPGIQTTARGTDSEPKRDCKRTARQRAGAYTMELKSLC